MLGCLFLLPLPCDALVIDGVTFTCVSVACDGVTLRSQGDKYRVCIIIAADFILMLLDGVECRIRDCLRWRRVERMAVCDGE